jgi:fatty acid desaturase
MVARRAMVITGLRWILRGVVSSFVLGEARGLVAARWVFYAAVAVALTLAGAWRGFALYWLVPFCTWHIAVQYIRLVCEHSAVRSEDEDYRVTRTTIPTFLETLFVLPKNVGYHLEHHWYPSVPFYNLPKFHERLMREARYRAHAEVHRSVRSALRACTRRS